MKKKVRQKLTLDQPATYQIKVPGQFDGSWSDWAAGKTVTVENDEDGLPVTAIIGSFDQAALQGFLRRLYSMGFPLISVNCIQSHTKKND